MKTILFQGDSITDAGRGNGLGTGYPLFVTARLGMDRPGEFNFINRGVSGNRVVDVYARILADIINLKPDYMSLLIGVNDVWHGFSGNGVEPVKFEKILRMLLEEILEALPDIKIMLLEPFCLRGSATDYREEDPERWTVFSEGVKQRAEIVKRVAEDYRLTFIPLQGLLDSAAARTRNEDWLFDGVHPAPAGHELIAREWVKAFETIC